MQEVRKNNREAKDAFFCFTYNNTILFLIQQLKKQLKNQRSMIRKQMYLTFRHFQQVRNLCNETQKKKFDTVIQQVLRMIAPPQGKPQGPPPRRGEGMHDGPPPGDDRREPPPPQQ
jgi:hypothetical protein